MKFCEAMELLKAGKKVTRTQWKGSIYFVTDEKGDVKSYQPHLVNYLYNEDIMISDGWLVEDEEQPMNFCDIIPYLQKGKRAKMTDWNDSYIFLDPTTGHLVLFRMDVFDFIPGFEAFTAQDWMTVE